MVIVFFLQRKIADCLVPETVQGRPKHSEQNWHVFMGLWEGFRFGDGCLADYELGII